MTPEEQAEIRRRQKSRLLRPNRFPSHRPSRQLIRRASRQ